jgi:hypothetical protein
LANLRQYGYPIADPENVSPVSPTPTATHYSEANPANKPTLKQPPLLANPADETAITAAAPLALPHWNG